MPRRPAVSIDYERECLLYRLPGGTSVYTHYSFLFTALFITSTLWFQGRLSSIVVAVALMVMLHLSVLAHEVGHALEARRQHAHTKEIEIHAFGGYAHLEWDYHRGLDRRRIALAGPAVNVGLAAVLFALYELAVRLGADDIRNYAAPFQAPGILSRVLLLSAAMNIILVVVNLLPAVPLDGGIIAEGLLSPRLGHRRARLIVACCGMMFGCVSAVVALITLLMGMPILAPPSFRQNLAAARESWRGGPPSSSSPAPFARRSNVVTLPPRRRQGGRP